MMGKLSPFQIINLVDAIYLFQILFTVEQTRISWLL